ncbi:hypothetical protein [Aquiflexum lacus]|uniref:hypothetical protein n=1 Tax=Aquiflexum lacus TaxID=2483805 RepID=UPI001894030D|nr:hypothetical protein [Aquiflexum lacus]
MSDFFKSQYVFSLIKGEEKYKLTNEMVVQASLHEKPQYFIRISNAKEEDYTSGLESNQPKIFSIKFKDEFCYVGYAHGPLISRLTQDLAKSIAKAYMKESGFETEELILDVFEFIPFADVSRTETRNFYQSIQSELVFLIKTKTVNWPTLQKQIGLSNHNREDAKKLALEMFETIK